MINPFKNSDLKDLQESICFIFNKIFGKYIKKIRSLFSILKQKGKKKYTVRIIPHNGNKISTYITSLFTIITSISIIILIVLITSITIVKSTHSIKQISKLKVQKNNSKLYTELYNNEIIKFQTTFLKLKRYVNKLYSITIKNDKNSLWDNEVKPILDNGYKIPNLEAINIRRIRNNLKIVNNNIFEISSFLQRKKSLLNRIPSILPVSNYKIIEKNEGIDIISKPNEEIKSTSSGIVEKIDEDVYYGIRICIKHNIFIRTYYNNIKKILVKEKQKVSKNQLIGYTDSMNMLSNVNLFYQLKIGNKFINPLPFIKK